MGLDPGKHLGKEIAFLDPYLHKLKEYEILAMFSLFLFIYYMVLHIPIIT